MFTLYVSFNVKGNNTIVLLNGFNAEILNHLKINLMYSDRTYKLTKDEYNYLLPTIYNKYLLSYPELETYYIFGLDLEDILNRLKGLYNYYSELPSILSYKCFTKYSLKEFRDFINTKN